MANPTYADFVTFIHDKMEEYLSEDEAALYRLVDNAVAAYSVDFPLVTADQTTGDGTYTYSLPSNWEDGFSYVVNVEYPYGEQTPVYTSPKIIEIYLDANDNTKKLRFKNATPSSSDTFGLIYTIPHTISDTTSTIPSIHFTPVACLAVALAARATALKFAQRRDVDIGSTLQLESNSRILEAIADEYEREYSKFLGIKRGMTSETLVYDSDYSVSWAGYPVTMRND